MDSIGTNRWQTKLNQHREKRKDYFLNVLGVLRVYERVTEYNGTLIHNWIDIFRESWKREKTVAPNELADIEKSQIAGIISEEQARINKELLEFWGDSKALELKAGAKILRDSCAVLLAKCFEQIENERVVRISEIESERKDRREKWIERLIQFGSGAAVAVIAALLTNYLSREDVKSIRAELSDLRKEYVQMVQWVIKSPGQLDLEISRLTRDEEERITAIKEKFVNKRKDYANEMAGKGVLDSGMYKAGVEKLKKEEDAEIKAARLENQRRIQDLREKKKQMGFSEPKKQ